MIKSLNSPVDLIQSEVYVVQFSKGRAMSMASGTRIFACVLITGFLVVMSGCCGGDTTTVEKQPIVIQPPPGASPTVGTELQSLEDAYKKGLITKEQYEAAKKKLLENVGK
jgi:hypothetical protein